MRAASRARNFRNAWRSGHRHRGALPLHPGLTYYRQQGYRPEDTPVAARVGRETVTLPLFPAMQDEDVPRVCRAVREVLGVDGPNNLAIIAIWKRLVSRN